jgi:hypothetical protein
MATVTAGKKRAKKKATAERPSAPPTNGEPEKVDMEYLLRRNEYLSLIQEKSTPAEPMDDDSWRQVSVIEGVGATGKMAELLEENGITNMGQFVDADGEGKVRNIKGIGEKKYDQMKDSMVAFLEKHRDKQVLAEARKSPATEPSGTGQPHKIRYRMKDGQWSKPYVVERWMGRRAVIKVGNATKTLKPNQFEAADE